MTTAHVETVAERIEHDARELMAHLPTPRGWDEAREQVEDREHLDVLLDEFNALVHGVR